MCIYNEDNCDKSEEKSNPMLTSLLLRSALRAGIRGGLSRWFCTSTAQHELPSATHVAGGVCFFIAAERGTAAMLDACDIMLPASVTALVALGTCAAHPRLGTPLQRALGPGTAWLRAALPWLTAPAFLCPAVATLPDREVLPRLAVLSTGGVLLTAAVAGHLAGALMSHSAAPIAIACAASTAQATAALSSPAVAAVALGAGLAVSGVLYVFDSAGTSRTTNHPAWPAMVKAPGYIGATLCFYVAAARVLPPAARRWLPPNVGCALALLPALLIAGGMDEVREYLAGAGEAQLWAVQPAMVTLGLYAHTHRALFTRQAAAIGALAACAPCVLFAVAWAGSGPLGLSPPLVASVLPASTTTGLALTMHTGLPLIQHEWVAAGTAFNSALAQTTMPLLLATTGLRASPPFARGAAVGTTAHVGGMAALVVGGEHAAADAAAVALVVCGVVRAALMQLPAFSRALARACGADEAQAEAQAGLSAE